MQKPEREVVWCGPVDVWNSDQVGSIVYDCRVVAQPIFEKDKDGGAWGSVLRDIDFYMETIMPDAMGVSRWVDSSSVFGDENKSENFIRKIMTRFQCHMVALGHGSAWDYGTFFPDE